MKVREVVRVFFLAKPRKRALWMPFWGKDLGKKTNIPQTFTTDHLLFDISFSHQQQAIPAPLVGVLALGGQKLEG